METILAIGSGSIKLVLDVAVIVIPIMVALEILKDLHWLDRVASWLAPALSRIHLSRAAALPLLVGLIFGIAYGAGVIIAAAREGELSGGICSCSAFFSSSIMRLLKIHCFLPVLGPMAGCC